MSNTISHKVVNAIDVAITRRDTGGNSFDAQAWLEYSAAASHDLHVLEQQWLEINPSPPLPMAVGSQSDLTIYEMLDQSENTTQLVRLLQDQPTLVSVLEDTSTNHTVWAPSDTAFSRFFRNNKAFSSDDLGELLQLHITPHFMPVRRILGTPNVPVLLFPSSLNGAQRLRIRPSVNGMTVNLSAHMIASDIFACNGVIHVIDAVVVPPPPVLSAVLGLSLVHYSRVQRMLTETWLKKEFADVPRKGCTFFVPSDEAFRRLGVEINAFIFSEEGEGYLRALLKYHIAPNQTLYSNALYDTSSDPYASPPSPSSSSSYYFTAGDPPHRHRLIKGRRCFVLSTMIPGLNLSIDVARHGGLITMRVNESATVTIQDQIASDGVVHVVDSVLIPPRKLDVKGDNNESLKAFRVADLKARMVDYL